MVWALAGFPGGMWQMATLPPVRSGARPSCDGPEPGLSEQGLGLAAISGQAPNLSPWARWAGTAGFPTVMVWALAWLPGGIWQMVVLPTPPAESAEPDWLMAKVSLFCEES